MFFDLIYMKKHAIWNEANTILTKKERITALFLWIVKNNQRDNAIKDTIMREKIAIWNEYPPYSLKYAHMLNLQVDMVLSNYILCLKSLF